MPDLFNLIPVVLTSLRSMCGGRRQVELTQWITDAAIASGRFAVEFILRPLYSMYQTIRYDEHQLALIRGDALQADINVRTAGRPPPSRAHPTPPRLCRMSALLSRAVTEPEPHGGAVRPRPAPAVTRGHVGRPASGAVWRLWRDHAPVRGQHPHAHPGPSLWCVPTSLLLHVPLLARPAHPGPTDRSQATSPAWR